MVFNDFYGFQATRRAREVLDAALSEGRPISPFDSDRFQAAVEAAAERGWTFERPYPFQLKARKQHKPFKDSCFTLENLGLILGAQMQEWHLLNPEAGIVAGLVVQFGLQSQETSSGAYVMPYNWPAVLGFLVESGLIKTERPLEQPLELIAGHGSRYLWTVCLPGDEAEALRQNYNQQLLVLDLKQVEPRRLNCLC